MGTCKQIGELFEGHNSVSVAVSPNDSRYIVSRSKDNTIRTWAMRPGKGVGEPLQRRTDWFHSVAISPDETRYIMSESTDHTIRVWEMSTVKQAGEALQGHIGDVNSVAISPDAGTWGAAAMTEHLLPLTSASVTFVAFHIVSKKLTKTALLRTSPNICFCYPEFEHPRSGATSHRRNSGSNCHPPFVGAAL